MKLLEVLPPTEAFPEGSSCPQLVSDGPGWRKYGHSHNNQAPGDPVEGEGGGGVEVAGDHLQAGVGEGAQGHAGDQGQGVWKD